MKFRPFAKEDWYGYAGCLGFPDGSEPLIADVKIDGHDAYAILDREGLGIDVYNEDGDALITAYFSIDYAARAIAMIGDNANLSSAVLRAMPGAEVEIH